MWSGKADKNLACPLVIRLVSCQTSGEKTVEAVHPFVVVRKTWSLIMVHVRVLWSSRLVSRGLPLLLLLPTIHVIDVWEYIAVDTCEPVLV